MKKLADISTFDNLQEQAFISVFNGQYTDELVKKELREGGSKKARTRFPGFEPSRSYVNIIVDLSIWLADAIEQTGDVDKMSEKELQDRIGKECRDAVAAYVDNGFFGNQRVDEGRVAKEVTDMTIRGLRFLHDTKQSIDMSWLDDVLKKAAKDYTTPKKSVN